MCCFLRHFLSQINMPGTVTFCLKELKTLLNFADYTGEVRSLRFLGRVTRCCLPAKASPNLASFLFLPHLLLLTLSTQLLSIYFTTGGRPILFTLEARSYQADFVLATLGNTPDPTQAASQAVTAASQVCWSSTQTLQML